ncbi:MFS transporter [Streptomyces sp. SID5910]|uniref:MFS transporter n=1 Tax=Streptomyces sp. SID5910 TaxID=2690312 RepID=UPI00136F4004|nr:MFS transporter [Streptomyces sp. SID5910]
MQSRPLTRGLTLLLAVVCGITTANAYYAQPLLDRMAHDLNASSSAVSLLVTTGQIGVACGLLFVVPAADIMRRQFLLTALFALDALALAGSALAPDVLVLDLLAVLIGVGAVAIPILTAYAAGLADDATRGRALGVIMGGVLFGILLSRTVASLIAALGGWRTVYAVAALAMAVVTVAVPRIVRDGSRPLRMAYGAQVLSVLTQFRDHPVLRTRCFLGACVMGAFTAFWTSVAFLLTAPPFSYSQIGIGVFALSGVAGALITSGGGRLIDRYRHWRWQSSGVCLAVLALSFALLMLGGTSIVWLVAGAVVMDAAIQAVHVTNQSVVYELNDDARSRLASGYMISFALGGAVGSACSAEAYHRWGWNGSCWVGVALAAAGLLAWAFGSGAERARQHQLRARYEEAGRSPTTV